MSLKEKLAALTDEQRAELAAELGTKNDDSDLRETVNTLQAEILELKKSLGGAAPPARKSWLEELFGDE